MSHSSVHSLLNAKLKEFAVENGYPVVWENRRFKPNLTNLYLKPHLLTGEKRAAALGPLADNVQSGIYQVDIKAPQNSGWKMASDAADLLEACFFRGLKLANEDTRITIRSVSTGPAMNEDTRYKVPISINFYAYMDPANREGV